MVNIVKSIFTFFTLFLACAIYVVQAQIQHITLYDGFNQVGKNLTLVANNAQDLKYYSFDGMARSACFTGGWLFYNLFLYNVATSPDAKMEYHFGNNSCVNLTLANNIASLRYVGSGFDYKESSITFYLGKDFKGQEAYIESDLPIFNWNGQSTSLIVTGSPNDSWTLYDSPNYEGNCVCVSPRASDEPYKPLFITDTTLAGFTYHKFQSVRKGCFAKNTINNNVNGEKIATRVENGFRDARSKPFFPAN